MLRSASRTCAGLRVLHDNLVRKRPAVMSCESSIKRIDADRHADRDGAHRETILFLHGSAGSGAIWRQVHTALGPMYRCLTPDLIGYGTATAWPADKPFNMGDELGALEPLLPRGAETFHIVGYSYGGVIALALALAGPARVRSLTLIEPVMFAALRYANEAPAYLRFIQVRDEFVAMLERDGAESAMSGFIDFWTAAGTWAGLAPQQRQALLGSAAKIALEWRVVFDFDPGLEGMKSLARRTALVRGDGSPPPMERLVDGMHALMPGSAHHIIAGANHMLPITHGAEFASTLMTHLRADVQPPLG